MTAYQSRRPGRSSKGQTQHAGASGSLTIATVLLASGKESDKRRVSGVSRLSFETKLSTTTLQASIKRVAPPEERNKRTQQLVDPKVLILPSIRRRREICCGICRITELNASRKDDVVIGSYIAVMFLQQCEET
jgi:hypothetical protein